MQTKDVFAGLESDDLSATVSAPARTHINRAPADYVPAAERAFTEKCPKCAGTGSTRWGVCFRCQGKGGKTFKTSPAARQQAKQSRVAKAQRTAAENLEAFAAAEPAVYAWFTGSTFPFAVAMREAVEKYGSLTERQLAASNNALDKLNAAKQQRQERIESAPAVNATALHEAFAIAASKGKRTPKLIVMGLRIKPAKASSTNAGALYVTQRSTNLYLGKVIGGKFLRTRDCDAEAEKIVLDVIADPKGAAIRSGITTTTCSVCGITLTDPASIAAGIGPTCATNFGW